MNAFVYAAGRSLRLGPEFADQQKILLKFGNKTILEWHADRLSRLGIHKMFIVTGYKREKIGKLLPKLQIKYGIEIQELVNTHYEEGSVISVYTSLPQIQKAEGTLLLMDGDVIYPSDLLQTLVQSRHPTALLIDRHYSTADDDPVLVPIRNGKPVEFLKGWKGSADLIGESVGFFKIDPRDKPLLIQEIKKRSVGMRRQENYDEIMRSLILAGRFRFEDITGLPWTEIDFPEDIEHAQNVVFPAIVRYEYNSYPKQKNPFQNGHLPKFI